MKDKLEFSMLRIIYNQKEKTEYGSRSLKKGHLEYYEETKTYISKVSDFTDMGIINIPPIFELMNKESFDIKVFTIDLIIRDVDFEIQYCLLKSPDGYTLQINDP